MREEPDSSVERGRGRRRRLCFVRCVGDLAHERLPQEAVLDDSGGRRRARLHGAGCVQADRGPEAALTQARREGDGGAAVRTSGGSAADRPRTVWAYLRLSDAIDETTAELAGSDDSALRAAVAALIDWFPGGMAREFAPILARDPVRQVQLALLEQLGSMEESAPALVSLVEEMARQEAKPFTCFHCGTKNTSDASSCDSCNTVTERPPVKALGLLAEWRRSTKEGTP
jgi:hypothetical protein